MGDVFAGRYELVDPLGEGGVGTVWRAWDRRRSHYCAVKVLRQVDAASLLRFIREQSLRLEHPHVLAPTGWAGEDDKVLFAMPMVRGGSVATLVGDFGPLPARLTAILLDQLLSALESIHSEGVVHRDVKPANLLLDATGTAHPHLWLGDFGIAAGIDEPRLTQGPYALGTPGYLAPEVRRQGWHPDPRADLYSAGMSAVEMLTGAPPEADADAAEALASAERPDPVPDALRELVTALAAPELRARIGAADDARRLLRETGLLDAAEHDASVGETSGAETSGLGSMHGEVEFFDHIPSLPEGWTPQGPAASSPPSAHRPEQVPEPRAHPPQHVPQNAAHNVTQNGPPNSLQVGPPNGSQTGRTRTGPPTPPPTRPHGGARAGGPPGGAMGGAPGGSPSGAPSRSPSGQAANGSAHHGVPISPHPSPMPQAARPGPPTTGPDRHTGPDGHTGPDPRSGPRRRASSRGLTMIAVAMMVLGLLLLLLMLWLIA